jgi:hypothetical protein
MTFSISKRHAKCHRLGFRHIYKKKVFLRIDVCGSYDLSILFLFGDASRGGVISAPLGISSLSNLPVTSAAVSVCAPAIYPRKKNCTFSFLRESKPLDHIIIIIIIIIIVIIAIHHRHLFGCRFAKMTTKDNNPHNAVISSRIIKPEPKRKKGTSFTFDASYRPKTITEKCQERATLLSEFVQQLNSPHGEQQQRENHTIIREYRMCMGRIDWMMAIARQERHFLYELRQLALMKTYYEMACARILHALDSKAFNMLYAQFTRDYEATPAHLLTETKVAQLWYAVFDPRACYAQPLAKDFCNTCVCPLLIMKKEANLVCPQCAITIRDLSPNQNSWMQQPIKHEKLYAMRKFVEKTQQQKSSTTVNEIEDLQGGGGGGTSSLMVDSPIFKTTVPLDSLTGSNGSKWTWPSSAPLMSPLMLPPPPPSSPLLSSTSTSASTSTSPSPPKKGQKRKTKGDPSSSSKEEKDDDASPPLTKKIATTRDPESKKKKTDETRDPKRFVEKVKLQLERFCQSDEKIPHSIVMQVHLYIKTKKNNTHHAQHESIMEKYVIDALKSNEMRESGGKKYLKHSARIACLLNNSKFEELNESECSEMVDRSRIFFSNHQQYMPEESIAQSLIICKLLKFMGKHRIARYFTSQRTPQCFLQQVKAFQTIVGFIKNRPLTERQFESW